MIPFALHEVAAALRGRLADVPDPATEITGPVVVDSREAGPGSLFAALEGEHADGHDYAAAAVEAG
ncbi:MAG: Mur ligase domain-containing protein, partial [Carbonactinosporaceae bacterium]